MVLNGFGFPSLQLIDRVVLNKRARVVRGYFCPKCAISLRQSECKVEKRMGFVWQIVCPRCSTEVEYSGMGLLLCGLVAALVLGGTSNSWEQDFLGCVICIPLAATGILRSIRQSRIAKADASVKAG